MLEQKYKAILSINFDNTIVNTNFPSILSVKDLAKECINSLYDQNFFIIIDTCRTGEHLIEATNFLDEKGIKYHNINENNEFIIHIFRNNSRKISADIYIDDKDINVLINPNLLQWHTIYENILNVVSKQNFRTILNIS